MLRDLLADGDGRAAVVAAIGVHREQDIVADRAAHRRDVPDIVVGAETDFHLHRLEACVDVAARFFHQGGGPVGPFPAKEPRGVGLHARAKRAAQQLVDRLLERLAHDVPQRDVDGADRSDVGALVVQPFPDDFVIERIAADHMRVERTARRHRCPFAPAGDAGVGYHFDQAERALSRGAHGVREWILDRIYRRVRLDVDDFHFTAPEVGVCQTLRATFIITAKLIRRNSSPWNSPKVFSAERPNAWFLPAGTCRTLPARCSWPPARCRRSACGCPGLPGLPR